MRESQRRGQVLVIAAMAMAILLGIAALVVDVGFAWILLRAEQNAVDPAAVAAARHIPDGTSADMEEAACFYVQEHGFFTTDNATCDAAQLSGELYVGPPTSGTYAGSSSHVEVRIDVDHPTLFGRVFGWPSIGVATSAVAANGGGSANANSLVALDPATCGAGMLTGNGVIDVGGFVYINSLCGIDPPYGANDDQCSNEGGDENDPHGAMQINGNQATLITPRLIVRGTCDKTSNGWNGDTEEGADEISDTIYGTPEPDYSTMVERGGRTFCPSPAQLLSPGYGCVFEGAHGYPAVLEPGVYYGGWVIRGQAKLHLRPGIYYIAGGGIQLSGNPSNVLEAIDGAAGEPGRVLIFSTGDSTHTGSCVENADYPAPPPVSWTQYARPSGDALAYIDGVWTGDYLSIDEVTFDDTDFLASPLNPSEPNVHEVTLSGVDTPADLTGVVVRYRYAKSANAGQTIDLTVELREGVGAGTPLVIASQTHEDIPGEVEAGGWQEGEFTLTTTEANSIDNWWDLSIRIDPTAEAAAVVEDERQAQLSWAEVEVPPGTAAFEARRCQGKLELTGGNSLKLYPTDISPWAGLVIWQDGTMPADDGHLGPATNRVAKVDLGGQGEMFIAGTVYAPQAKCYLRGNGSSNPSTNHAGVQMVCWQFEVVGNGTLDMPYDPNLFFGHAQKGLVR